MRIHECLGKAVLIKLGDGTTCKGYVCAFAGITGITNRSRYLIVFGDCRFFDYIYVFGDDSVELTDKIDEFTLHDAIQWFISKHPAGSKGIVQWATDTTPAIITSRDFPHTCPVPTCRSAAYISPISGKVECSNNKCTNYKE